MKVTDFLEGPFLDAVLDRDTFRHENFYEVFTEAIEEISRRDHDVSKGSPFSIRLEKDLFTASFLGAFLWLLKYRTLSTNRNSPRKLAFLDMLFDIEIARLIDKRLGGYNTARIREVYETMDIRCKQEYTGEMTRGEPPPFLVSPIWARDAHSTPFHVAVKVFTQLMVSDPSLEGSEVVLSEPFIGKMVQRFIVMTEPIEKVSARINFSWSAPRE